MLPEKKILYSAIIVSLAAHTAILLQAPDWLFLPKNKTEQQIAVHYIKSVQPPEAPLREIVRKTVPVPQLPPKVDLDGNLKVPVQDKTSVREVFKNNTEAFRQQASFMKPAALKPDTIEIKKKITLPQMAPMEEDKIKNPSYIGYYQLVREKIRRAAYHNYVRTETGEVFLSFVVGRDGSLKDLRLQEGRSSGSPYLAQVAEKSIREAAPFTAFPQDLDYPQLSFNVIISFQVE